VLFIPFIPFILSDRQAPRADRREQRATMTATYGIAPPAFRLPAASHVGRVRLQVADLARSIAYYEQVIGFRVLSHSEESGVRRATLAAHGDDRPLVELHERAGARPVPQRGRLGLYHFAILLPDRASLGRFVTHLGEIGAHAGMSDHFVSEAVYLSDPDGLGIEVYADRPRSTWKYQGGQLYMTTAHMNVADVVRAGGGMPWTGMPAGTTIGHIHLYVADIDQAAAFYHAGLGFDKVVWNYPGALFMSAGGYHHHLGTNTWAAHAPAAEEGDARLIEWELVVPDRAAVEDAARSLEHGGATVERAGDGDSALARDPWGTAVRIAGRR
jgi:catechol 2,3-dioxygenase